MKPDDPHWIKSVGVSSEHVPQWKSLTEDLTVCKNELTWSTSQISLLLNGGVETVARLE